MNFFTLGNLEINLDRVNWIEFLTYGDKETDAAVKVCFADGKSELIKCNSYSANELDKTLQQFQRKTVHVIPAPPAFCAISVPNEGNDHLFSPVVAFKVIIEDEDEIFITGLTPDEPTGNEGIRFPDGRVYDYWSETTFAADDFESFVKSVRLRREQADKRAAEEKTRRVEG